MQIEQIKIKDLKPYEANARTHDKKQIAKVAASITEFGFTAPVLIADDLTILAGHGRVSAAKLLKMAEVPCVKLAHLNETQRRAYVLADNQLSTLAGWDYDLLNLEMEEIKLAGFDFEIIGFTDADLKTIFPDDPETDLLPPPDTGDKYKEQFGVVVMCDSEKNQAETYKKLHESGYKCKVVTV
jgi:ParB-like chromosome segregation protein Spo0J